MMAPSEKSFWNWRFYLLESVVIGIWLGVGANGFGIPSKLTYRYKKVKIKEIDEKSLVVKEFL